jgi:hypothetical protein
VQTLDTAKPNTARVIPVRGWAAEAPAPELEHRQGSFLAGLGIKPNASHSTRRR